MAVARVNTHISDNHLLPSYQSAFRKGHSTETAIAVVMNDIIRTIDRGEVCALVLLDLSAAFDTIDHGILFEILNKRFGMQHKVEEWVQSYFEGRTQICMVGIDVSDARVLKHGVPQGSVAGPSKFVCYTEDLQEVVTSFSVKYHLYADDTQLLARTILRDLDTCRHEMEICVSTIHEWCSSRRLQLNSNKTELIWFGSSTMLKQLQDLKTSIRVGDVDVKAVTSVRDLGVILDCNLNMQSHISKVVSTCFFHLRRLRQLRQYLDRDIRQRLVSAIILSRIDYCNISLVGLPMSSLQPLQRVINAAARFVANLKPRDHVSGVMRDLHWLPIRERITFKLCLLMHNIVHGSSAPEYMTGMVTCISALPGRSHLRSAGRGLYDVPRVRTSFGSRAFSVAGPSAWNRLPNDVRETKNVLAFKTKLKTHLFDIAYP